MLKVSPVFKQLLAAISCNLLIFSSYTIYGWATINSNDLQLVNSTFPTGTLTFAEVSSIISISSIGSLIGNFAVLPVIHWLGPKSANHLFTIPLIVSALLILCAQNIYFLHASRLLCGIASGGSAVSVQSFSIDISSDKYKSIATKSSTANVAFFVLTDLFHLLVLNSLRGVLNALYDLSENAGFIASFLLANYLSALDQAKIYLIIPTMLVAVLFLYPESPEYWLRKRNYRQANRSFKFYKGIENNKNGIEIEIETNEVDITKNSKLTLKDFLTPHAKKSFFISISLAAMYILSGTVVLIDYSAEIFARTESSVSPKSSSLLISVAKLIGNSVFLVIVERFSRKSFLLGSTIVSAVFFFLFGAHNLLWLHQPEFDWMPAFCAACINMSSGMGMSQLPFLISMEIFPKKIRSICISFTLCFLWFSLFAIESIFPFLLNHIGLSGCLISFGTMCLVNAIAGSFIIPDTRGKSYDEIMKMLTK